jgi:hypothetical protein
MIEETPRSEEIKQLQSIIIDSWPLGCKLYYFSAIFSTDGVVLIEPKRRYQYE